MARFTLLLAGFFYPTMLGAAAPNSEVGTTTSTTSVMRLCPPASLITIGMTMETVESLLPRQSVIYVGGTSTQIAFYLELGITVAYVGSTVETADGEKSFSFVVTSINKSPIKLR